MTEHANTGPLLPGAGRLPDPVFDDGLVRLYHGDAAEILPSLGRFDLLLSDPPYPNGAGHFDDSVPVAEQVVHGWFWRQASRAMIFWHQHEAPACWMPLVARHAWHRTNTNRPDNYEAIYEYAYGPEVSSQVFGYPVIFPGLTGCVEATGHPTQKPEKLMRRLITLRKGVGSVLDPFCGSGSTLVAAKSLGVAAVGIEKDERWCEVAAKRLNQGVLDFGEAS